MKRREFIKAGIVTAPLYAVGFSAIAENTMPNHLPIINDEMNRNEYLPYYDEREITQPVDLCDDKGALNPDAVGWSRIPLHRCNLRGHWGRKKKWNFWSFISGDFNFNIIIADADYVGVAGGNMLDLKTKHRITEEMIRIPSNVLNMPDEVEKDISFNSPNLSFSMIHENGGIKTVFNCASMEGEQVNADFFIHKPASHENVNVVVPWTAQRFQFTAKQYALPTEGTVKVGKREYLMDPDKCFGALDFGRGMWPYRAHWNWAAGTGKQGSDILGINFGAKWTTGTGSNQNSVCLNSKLYKFHEDVEFRFDPKAPMKPWRVRTVHSNDVDISLTPAFNENRSLNLGLLKAKGNMSLGKWSGKLKLDGRTFEIKDLMGWAEENIWRW